MAVRIRLARAGTKKVPFYRIVAADRRCARGGRFIERLGCWDPRRSELTLNQRRVDYWLGHGASPSHTVSRLLKKAQAHSEAAASEEAAKPDAAKE